MLLIGHHKKMSPFIFETIISAAQQWQLICCTKKTFILHPTSMHYIDTYKPCMTCLQTQFASFSPKNLILSYSIYNCEILNTGSSFYRSLHWIDFRRCLPSHPLPSPGSDGSSHLRPGGPVPGGLGGAPKAMAGELPQEIAGAMGSATMVMWFFNSFWDGSSMKF